VLRKTCGTPLSKANSVARNGRFLECLGAAVVSASNELPTDIQRAVFRRAASQKTYEPAELEAQIARFLHKHNLARFPGDAVGHADAEAFLGATLSTDKDIVIVDLALPGFSGGKVIEWLLGVRTPLRVVAITDQRKIEFEKQIAELHIHVIRQPLTAAALPLLA
jgi:hypothetical protein